MPSLIELTGSRLDLFLFDVSLKAAAIFAAAWAVSLILSRCRSSAATRHLVWSLAIAGVLGLPLLTATLPPWSISAPWPKTETLPPPATDAPQAGSERGDGVLAWTQSQEVSSAPLMEPEFGHETAVGSTQQILGDSAAPPRGDLPGATGWTWLLWGWLIGACLASLPTCLGLVSLRCLTRRSRSVTGGRLFTALQQMRSQLGLTCSVRLLQSPNRSMPMTWGIWRPTILLPEEAELWSGDRLRTLLLHELAHVQRHDCLTEVFAQVARAAYWFNPLAWLAERRLRIEQEQACDDLVLSNGFEAPDYAEHLLAVSAGFRSPACASAIALGMGASKIERRLMSILNPCQNRRPLSRRWIGLVALTALALLFPLSVLHFESAAAGVEPPAENVNENAPSAPRANQATDRAKALADLRVKIAEQYVAPVDENEIVQGAIKGMIGALRDPYSDYLTPEMVAEMEKQLGGRLVGIGVQLEMHEKRLRVVTALQDSPALEAGIQPGDVILEIDGKTTAGIDLPEAVKRIAGPQGTVVRLKVGRDPGQELEVNIARSPIQIATVKGFRRGPDNHWDFLLDAGRKIGYVQIAQFGTATTQELRNALESLKKQGLAGLILDLRFCPGGALEAAVGVSKLFLSGGTIVSIHSRDGSPLTIAADASSALGDFPLVVLVNGETASAAEVVARALQDNHRALVLGTRTFGKGSVQTLIKLEEGSGAIKLTTSHYRLPSGRNIDKRAQEKFWGIDPDEGYFVPVDRTQMKTLLQRRQEREIIGRKSDEPASQNAEVTAKWIGEQQADPQLAAALKTLTARVATGEFAKVSQFSPTQVEQFLKREEVERRREAVLQSLQQLNRELADLEKEAPTENQSKSEERR